VLWAVVSATPEVIRARNVSSLEAVGTGEVAVEFDQDITQCDYQATLGSTAVGTPPTGTIGVALRIGDPDSVFVETKNGAGTLTSEPFHLAVFC
jgi:hypothetical protein